MDAEVSFPMQNMPSHLELAPKQDNGAVDNDVLVAFDDALTCLTE